MKKGSMLAVSMLAGLVLLAGTVVAQDMKAGTIEYRQKMMGALSGHLGGVGQILKHGLDYKDHIKNHAQAVANIAAVLPEVFPEGTGEGKTDALPAIWSDMGGFKDAANKLREEAEKLASVAMSGGDVGAQVKNVGKACGGCHKEYRQPKEKQKMWEKKM